MKAEGEYTVDDSLDAMIDRAIVWADIAGKHEARMRQAYRDVRDGKPGAKEAAEVCADDARYAAHSAFAAARELSAHIGLWGGRADLARAMVEGCRLVGYRALTASTMTKYLGKSDEN